MIEAIIITIIFVIVIIPLLGIVVTTLMSLTYTFFNVLFGIVENLFKTGFRIIDLIIDKLLSKKA